MLRTLRLNQGANLQKMAKNYCIRLHIFINLCIKSTKYQQYFINLLLCDIIWLQQVAMFYAPAIPPGTLILLSGQ